MIISDNFDTIQVVNTPIAAEKHCRIRLYKRFPKLSE